MSEGQSAKVLVYDSDNPPPLDLNRWAEIAAALLKRAALERAEILDQRGVELGVWTACDAYWNAELADDLALGETTRAAVYAGFCAQEMKRRKEERKTALTKQEVAKKAEEEEERTIETPGREEEMANESVEETLREGGPKYVPTYLRTQPEGAESLNVAPKPPVVDRPSVIETPSLGQKPALVQSPVGSALGSTAMALDIPRGPEMPFQANVSPDVAMARAKDHAEKVQPAKTPIAPSGETLPVSDIQAIAKSILPFGFKGQPKTSDVTSGHDVKAAGRQAVDPKRGSAPVVKPSAELAETAMESDIGAIAKQILPFGASPSDSAPETPPHSPSAMPQLTMEQYASLCVELDMAPGHRTMVLQRYHLGEEDRVELDRIWIRKFGADAGLRQAFEHAKEAYRRWLLSQRSR